MAKPQGEPCAWLSLRDAISAFVRNSDGHQGAAHIKPFHWYVACRLVLEGGFLPEDVTPRPPFQVTRTGAERRLTYDASAGGTGEQTLLGGLKTKAVDVVVCKPGIGPVLAVSMKGTLNAFRNLTNRMEEAVGDCTNLHISYPALVYGFFQVLRANRQVAGVPANDVAVRTDGRVVDSIGRYHEVLSRLSGRSSIRDTFTKYEAVCLVLASTTLKSGPHFHQGFPPAGSELDFEGFFERLYRQYDERFVYAAPKLEAITRRIQWAPTSPILGDSRLGEYQVRLGDPDELASDEPC